MTRETRKVSGLVTSILDQSHGRLVEPILGEQFRDTGVDGLRGGYVDLATESIGLLDLGKTACVCRAGANVESAVSAASKSAMADVRRFVAAFGQGLEPF